MSASKSLSGSLVFAGMTVAVVFLSCVPLTESQFYSTRTCTANSSVVQERCVNMNNAFAQFACSTYCSSGTSQNSTQLYKDFCTAANQTCGVTSYCTNAQLLFNQTVVPTLTNIGSSVVNVPCGFAYTNIAGALLGVTNPGNQTYFINKQVISSSPSDSRVSYIQALPSGTIARGSVGPLVTTTQTIAFTAQQQGTGVFSNTVTITFIFQPCTLSITCPPSVTYDVCFGTPITVLDCQVNNAPSTLSLTYDTPGNLGATAAQLALVANGPASPTFNAAPAVQTSTVASDAGLIFIVDYNTVSLAGITNPNGPIAAYGVNTFQGNYQAGCQTLLFSVMPTPGQVTPYVQGSTTAQVCGCDNEGCTTGLTPVTPACV